MLIIKREKRSYDICALLINQPTTPILFHRASLLPKLQGKLLLFAMTRPPLPSPYKKDEISRPDLMHCLFFKVNNFICYPT